MTDSRGVRDTLAHLVLGGVDEQTWRDSLAEEHADLDLRLEAARLERGLAPLAQLLTPLDPLPDRFDALLERIDAEHADLPSTLTFRPSDLVWEPFSEGVDIAELWRSPRSRRKSLFLRLQPGARYQSHGHDDDEECLVLEGDIAFGELVLRAGDYHVAPPGRDHPAATSRHGCLCFVTCEA